MTHLSMFWFKESTERRKTSFLKEIVENADLHKAVLNKTMTTQELFVRCDFDYKVKYNRFTASQQNIYLSNNNKKKQQKNRKQKKTKTKIKNPRNKQSKEMEQYTYQCPLNQNL